VSLNCGHQRAYLLGVLLKPLVIIFPSNCYSKEDLKSRKLNLLPAVGNIKIRIIINKYHVFVRGTEYTFPLYSANLHSKCSKGG
jgi:hypothetical protein